MEQTSPAPVGRGSRLLDLDALDRLAHWAVDAARPVRIELVGSAGELEQVQRLRGEVVLSRGWAPQGQDDAGPDGLERDDDDDRAVHVGAWEGARAVGTIRVVRPAEGRLLPTERAFDVVVEPRGQVVDWGRLVVSPIYRGPRRSVMLALLGRAWLASRELGALECVGVATPAVLDLYRSLGVQATVLAGPRLHWGEQRYAARLLGVAADAGHRMAAATAAPGVTTGAAS